MVGKSNQFDVAGQPLPLEYSCFVSEYSVIRIVWSSCEACCDIE